MLTNAKHNAFIAEWLTNGHNASEAYRTAYPKVRSGWNKHSSRLMARDDIKEEIKRKQALLVISTEMTVAKVQSMYQTAYDLAEETKQSSSMVSAVTGIARLYGMDKDANTDKQEPDQITDTELDRLKAMSKDITKPTLTQNKPPQARQA